MSNQSPTGNRDHLPDEPVHDDAEAQDDEAEQPSVRERTKGIDIPATTNAEDLDKAKRTTM